MTGFQCGHKPYAHAIAHGYHPGIETLKIQKDRILRHSRAISKEAERYRMDGFEVIELDRVRPDLIVRKNGRILAIEVEIVTPFKAQSVLRKKYAKYVNCHVFDDIVWKLQGDENMQNENNGDILR